MTEFDADVRVVKRRATEVEGMAIPVPEIDKVGGIGSNCEANPGTEAERIPN